MPSSSAPYTTVFTPDAPTALGPYVQSVKYGGLTYLSGNIGLDPKTMTIVSGGIEEQANQVFLNIAAVLKASGSSPAQVLKTTVFLKNMDDFAVFNAIYAKFFGDTAPARSCVEVARLPIDVLVEVECFAVATD